MNVTVEEITRDPQSILHRVREGETLIVTEQDRPVTEIRPIEAVRRPRPFVLARALSSCPTTSTTRCPTMC
jgi:antitoxin (DNA-binding transcriptional repressor) of toxin-antitoxin stability system